MKKNLTYLDFAIKTSTLSEKVAAAYFLGEKTKYSPEKIIRLTFDSKGIAGFPYIVANRYGNYINAYTKDSSELTGKVFVDFSDMLTIDKLIEESKKVEVNVYLNKEYTAVVSEDGVKVGCQTFSFDAIRDLMKVIEEVETSK